LFVVLLYVPIRVYVTTGVAEFEALDDNDVPLALVAVTVNVYAVFTVKPLTITGEDAPEPVCAPLEVAVNVDIAFPPVAPAVNATDADVELLPGDAVPIVGAAGTVVAVALDAVEASPVPTVFIAETL
jgi:hypothetical protein